MGAPRGQISIPGVAFNGFALPTVNDSFSTALDDLSFTPQAVPEPAFLTALTLLRRRNAA